MYEGEVYESPPRMKTSRQAIEERTQRKQNNRDENDRVREAFQRYPRVIEILRKLAAKAG
jgi:hypothetical protein